LDNKVTFDRANPEHVDIVKAILAEDIRSGDVHVAYEIPKEPQLQDWFYGLIKQGSTVGVGRVLPSFRL